MVKGQTDRCSYRRRKLSRVKCCHQGWSGRLRGTDRLRERERRSPKFSLSGGCFSGFLFRKTGYGSLVCFVRRIRWCWEGNALRASVDVANARITEFLSLFFCSMRTVLVGFRVSIRCFSSPPSVRLTLGLRGGCNL